MIDGFARDLAWRASSGDAYLRDHAAECRGRIAAAISRFRKLRASNARSHHRASDSAAWMEAHRNARVMTPEIRAVIACAAYDAGLTVEDLVSASKSVPILKARRAAIQAMWRSWPGRPLIWYGRPFGYHNGDPIRRALVEADLYRPKPPCRRKEDV